MGVFLGPELWRERGKVLPLQMPNEFPFLYTDFEHDSDFDLFTKLRPPDAGWGISAGECYINMDPNEDFYTTVNNAPLLYVIAPRSNYIVQVKVRGLPDQNYEQGVLMVYQGDDDYIKLCHIYYNGEKLLWGYESGGSWTELTTLSYSGEVVYLRIEKVDDTYIPFYSTDGVVWTQITPTYTVSYLSPKVGISAFSYSTAVMTFYFDNLLVRRR